MSAILEYLEAFNRKERFFLFTYATGNRGFVLSEQFRNDLGHAVHQDIPENAKAYIDYHLDWLHAAVVLAKEPDGGRVRRNRENVISELGARPGEATVSTGNQEDSCFVSCRPASRHSSRPISISFGHGGCLPPVAPVTSPGYGYQCPGAGGR